MYGAWEYLRCKVFVVFTFWYTSSFVFLRVREGDLFIRGLQAWDACMLEKGCGESKHVILQGAKSFVCAI